MVNILKLKGKLVENQMTISQISEKLGVDRSTIYRKINTGGESFTIGEVKSIAKELKLNIGEINSIFFAN